MDLGLFQQQTLKLVMTTELRQAITLLQYTATELQDFLEEQAVENPLIELKEPAYTTHDIRRKAPRSKRDRNDQLFEASDLSEPSLRDHLLEQTAFLPIEQEVASALHYLIDSLDENGYLPESLEEIAKKTGFSFYHLEKALSELHQLDPCGVGARTLQECVLMQLRQLPQRHPIAEQLVAWHFEPFALKKWKQLAKELELDVTAIQEAFDLVRELEPRPGARFASEKPKYIIPEFTVKKTGTGFDIVMNDQSVPQIQVNHDYEKLLSQQQDSEASKYMQDKYQQLLWLMKSIEQRRQTLLKVLTAIVERQKDFFQYGLEYLRPMTLKEIADDVGIHESTVSRAVKNKYVQTPHGLFELKFFFHAGVQTAVGEDASSLAVKEQIKVLIDNENAAKPLSDQKLADILKKEKGIVVSRRTVAKYREQMKIPASSQRKRY